MEARATSRALNSATPSAARETVALTENSLFLEFLNKIRVITVSFDVAHVGAVMRNRSNGERL